MSPAIGSASFLRTRRSIRTGLPRIFATLLFLLAAGGASSPVICDTDAPAAADATPGARASLVARGGNGLAVELPLKRTVVRAEVSGFVARVDVEQIYANPIDTAVEVRYVFPLPERAAVDDFSLEIGERVIRGEIRRREEAAAVYGQARAEGRTAALLEQERPNIFTQSVANIPPGGEIRVHLRYVDLLPYEAGAYRFLFPMVVGPRYSPGQPVAADTTGPGGTAPNAGSRLVDPRAVRTVATDRVPDADRISPPVLRPGYVSTHSVDLSVDLDAGVPIRDLTSDSHAIRVRRHGANRATIRLAPGDRIPNKDFMLKIGVASEEPEVGLLAHRDGGDGFFALRIQPKAWVTAEEAAPKEILFVVDASGSMSGAPLAMSKRLMRLALESLGPDDTFNIVVFSDVPVPLAARSLPSSPENVARGIGTVNAIRSGGGTGMIGALNATLALPADPSRIRIVLLLTDGFVGNENELFAAARNDRSDARIFSVGIGSSVNHHLLREMSEIGRGAYVYVRPDGRAGKIIDRFYGWVTRPYLTDLEIDWGSLAVEDVQPATLPDLYAGQTLSVVGRYLWEGSDTVIVRGRLGGEPWQTQLHVRLPEESSSHAVLASTWARERIRELLLHPDGRPQPEIRGEVTSLALAYHLMSPYTSFVAVDSAEIANLGAPPLRIDQAVPIPEFVSFTGCFGPEGPPAARPAPRVEQAPGAGVVAGRTLPVPDTTPKPPASPSAGSGASHGAGLSTLEGNVRDSGGHVVPGVVVRLGRTSGDAFARKVVTDAGGHYRFTGVPAARGYVIRVEHPGFVVLEVAPVDLGPGAQSVQDVTLRTVEELTQTVEIVTQEQTNDSSSAAVVQPPPPPPPPPPPGTFGQNLNIDEIEEIESQAAGAVAEYGSASGGFANIGDGDPNSPAGIVAGVAGGLPVGVAGGEPGHVEGSRETGLSLRRVLNDVASPKAPATREGIGESALRILADLSDDGILSKSEGLPALTGLVAAQRPDGTFGGPLREDAMATWALLEVLASNPEIPWIDAAAKRAVAALRSAADQIAASAQGDQDASETGRWLRLALSAAGRCRSAATGGAPTGTLAADLLARLDDGKEGITGHLVSRILHPRRGRLHCAAM